MMCDTLEYILDEQPMEGRDEMSSLWTCLRIDRNVQKDEPLLVVKRI